jgi:hypothetical protein
MSREVAPRRDHGDTQIGPARHGDHVARDVPGVPDSGIEPLGDDVDQARVGHELHPYVGVPLSQREHQGKHDELRRRTMGDETQGAAGLGPRLLNVVGTGRRSSRAGRSG